MMRVCFHSACSSHRAGVHRHCCVSISTPWTLVEVVRGIWYSVLSWYMMCSVVVVVVIVTAVVAAAAQPFLEDCRFQRRSRNLLSPQTLHGRSLTLMILFFAFMFKKKKKKINSGGWMVPLIRAEIRAAKTIEHCHSVHRSPKSERNNLVSFWFCFSLVEITDAYWN